MLKKLSAISCLGLATLGLLSLPAQADEANVQGVYQGTYIEGDGNRTTQINKQRIGSRRRGANNNGASVGHVQDTVQDHVIYGNDNDAYQRSHQTIRRSEQRGHRRDGSGMK